MKITMFYMPGCPHCSLAFRYLDELRHENPRWADIEIETIDETVQRVLADSYDYYYVPCFYLGRDKLHEGHAEREDISRVLDAAVCAAV
jgi:glutaredoxin